MIWLQWFIGGLVSGAIGARWWGWRGVLCVLFVGLLMIEACSFYETKLAFHPTDAETYINTITYAAVVGTLLFLVATLGVCIGAVVAHKPANPN